MTTGIEISNKIYNKRDIFKISNGNLETLKTVIEMMNNKKYREKLRGLALDYIMKNSLRRK